MRCFRTTVSLSTGNTSVVSRQRVDCSYPQLAGTNGFPFKVVVAPLPVIHLDGEASAIASEYVVPEESFASSVNRWAIHANFLGDPVPRK